MQGTGSNVAPSPVYDIRGLCDVQSSFCQSYQLRREEQTKWPRMVVDRKQAYAIGWPSRALRAYLCYRTVTLAGSEARKVDGLLQEEAGLVPLADQATGRILGQEIRRMVSWQKLTRAFARGIDSLRAHSEGGRKHAA